ncbi:MAG: hypothetical protein ACOYLH_06925, partial [Flavobacteriales bacterium]
YIFLNVYYGLRLSKGLRTGNNNKERCNKQSEERTIHRVVRLYNAKINSCGPKHVLRPLKEC